MRIPNVLRIITVISLLLPSACRTAPTATSPRALDTDPSLVQRPAEYIVVYFSDGGKAHPDPAVLIVDETKKQEIYFIAQGTSLKIRFRDADQFKVHCNGSRRCTAKLDPDRPHQNLFDYKYAVEWVDRQGVLRTVDPVVIIDEIGMTLRP